MQHQNNGDNCCPGCDSVKSSTSVAVFQENLLPPPPIHMHDPSTLVMQVAGFFETLVCISHTTVSHPKKQLDSDHHENLKSLTK